jgi:hypothetical protein
VEAGVMQLLKDMGGRNTAHRVLMLPYQTPAHQRKIEEEDHRAVRYGDDKLIRRQQLSHVDHRVRGAAGVPWDQRAPKKFRCHKRVQVRIYPNDRGRNTEGHIVIAMNFQDILDAKQAHRNLGFFRPIRRVFQLRDGGLTGTEVDFFAEAEPMQAGSEFVVTEGEDLVEPRDHWAHNQEAHFQMKH